MPVDEVVVSFLDMEKIGLECSIAVEKGISMHEINCIDIIEFCESEQWGNFKLFPAQSMFFKIAYKLWEQYPFTKEELRLTEIEKDKWGIDLLARCHEEAINHFMMIVGRRGLKSSTIAIIAAYEAYRLIIKDDPQKFYNLLQGTEIYITNAASNEEQAKTVYNLTSDRIKSIPFFKHYLDNSLDNSSEIALYSPKDVRDNDAILHRNSLIPRGEAYKKEKIKNGTIRIKSIPTSATGARSRGSIVVVFDEFAHFERSKTKGRGDPRELMGGNKRTDEAMYRALAPSSATYGSDYKIFVISSPADSSGKCYSLYTSWKEQISHYVQQFATWEVNPMVPENHPEITETEREDPVGFKMEWAGEFVASINRLISDAVIENMVNSSLVYRDFNVGNASYIVTLDPAKASDPDSDTYAVAWGHAEQRDNGEFLYFVDGLKGFTSMSAIDPQTNEHVSTELDPSIVDNFILALTPRLRRVVGLFYDQYNSTHSIHKFQKLHLPAMETTYTTPYKRDMYANFIREANSGNVILYGQSNIGGEGGDELEKFIMEAQHIQRVISGNSISYKHPESGPVTTDDYVDAVANLIHQLSRFCLLGADYLKDIRKNSSSPIYMNHGIKPTTGASLGGSPFQNTHKSVRSVNVANRIHGNRR